MLDFDPYAALAKIENDRGLRANWAKRANPACLDGGDGKILAQLAPLALSPALNSKIQNCDDLTFWRQELATPNESQPPDSVCKQRWARLVIDAQSGWGGLADRLHGARNVVLNSRQGRWRSRCEEGTLWWRTLRPMPPLWDIGQQKT